MFAHCSSCTRSAKPPRCKNPLTTETWSHREERAFVCSFTIPAMKRLLSFLLFSISAFAQQAPHPLRPVHTFSIVARDPVTGDMGVAVQSHWFSVGSMVTWAEPGVGAVATQAFVDPSYGKLALDLMRAGKSAPDTLQGLVQTDANNDVRQVAMIDTEGRVAAFTGCKAIIAAGHHVGGQSSAWSPTRSDADKTSCRSQGNT